MVAYGYFLAVLIVQVNLSANLGAIATVPNTDSDDPFLDSLIKFKEQYQNPAMDRPDGSQEKIQNEEVSTRVSLEPLMLPSRPSSVTTSKKPPKSPLSKKTIMDFQSSVEYRPFRGNKVVHSNYFFMPDQVTEPQGQKNFQYGAALSNRGGLRKRNRINPASLRPSSIIKTESSNLPPVEHILIDSSVLVNVICPHMRHDFISEEPVAGKFTLVNTKIKQFRFTNEEGRSQTQGLFFPNSFSNPFAFSYGSRLMVSVAYIGICIMVNLIFNIA